MKKTKKVKQLAEPLSQETRAKLKEMAHGKTGTSLFGGYFNEEYLPILTGRSAVLEFDKMRRGDYQIAMILRAIKNKLLSANFYFDPGEDEEQKKRADLMNHIFFKDAGKTWKNNLSDIITFCDFGFSILEPTFKAAESKEFGSYWGIKSYGYREQDSIYQWKIKDDVLISVNQQVYNDETVNVWIPGEDLVVFSLNREGNNFEGVSLIRSAYGPYFRKNLYHKINGIGIERHALGIIVGTVPANAINTTEETYFDEALSSYTSHEKAYIKTIEGWDVEIKENKFNADAVQKSINDEDVRIAKSVLTQFVELGTNGTGSYNLAEIQAKDFTASIRFLGDVIVETLEPFARKIAKWNFGDESLCPPLLHTGIDEKAGKDLAETWKLLVDARIVNPDAVLEAHARKTYNLPEAVEVEEKEEEAPTDGAEDMTGEKQESLKSDKKTKASPDSPDNKKAADCGHGHKHADPKTGPRALTSYEKKVQFSEVKKTFDTKEADYLAFTKNNLNLVKEKMKADLRNGLKRAGTEAEKYKAIDKLEPGYRGKYRELMAAFIEDVIKEGRGQAAAEVKGTPKLADRKIPDINEIPAKVSAWVRMNAKIAVDKQLQSLFDKIELASINAVDAMLPDDEVVFAAGEAADKFIDNPNNVGPGIIIQRSINEGRFSMFQEFKSEIKGFQYSAVLDDRTTPLCEELDGQTFKIDDVRAVSMTPPLHPNCRSIIVPITMDEEDPEEWTGLHASPNNVADYKSLEEGKV